MGCYFSFDLKLQNENRIFSVMHLLTNYLHTFLLIVHLYKELAGHSAGDIEFAHAFYNLLNFDNKIFSS